jgi:transcriptional regulator with XRE-family HTH domain
MCAIASVLDELELEVATRIYDDIVFLLAPQLWEEDSSSIIKRVGRRFSYFRQKNRYTALEVASQIGVSLTVVEGMERGDIQGRGATFQGYFKYAHSLGLSLRELFSDAMGVFDHIPAISLPSCPVCQQSYYITRSGYNRSGSQRYLCQYCHRSFTASPKARGVKGLLSGNAR